MYPWVRLGRFNLHFIDGEHNQTQGTRRITVRFDINEWRKETSLVTFVSKSLVLTINIGVERTMNSHQTYFMRTPGVRDAYESPISKSYSKI